MFPIKTILFPVDFSPRCRGAAAYVEALAGRFEAQIILLHVVAPPDYNSTLETVRDVTPADFDKFFGSDLKHFRTEKLIDRGEPAQKIVECAAARQVDLIMMPTQGLGIYRRLIIGSSAAKVLHDADCPVWTGVHLENAPALDALQSKRILCAVDLKPASARVFDWASHLAAEYQAEITLLHVVPSFDEPHFIEHDFAKAIEAQARTALDDLQKVVGAKATVRIEAGSATKVVPAVAAQWNADLLVIGRKAESGILGRLQTTAYAIIRQSPCPVVSV
jgi:nucleotide-binding universal stress UspA family protein